MCILIDSVFFFHFCMLPLIFENEAALRFQNPLDPILDQKSTITYFESLLWLYVIVHIVFLVEYAMMV